MPCGSWNDAQIALSNAASVGSFFAEVHPDKAVRDRAETVAQEVQKLDTDLGLDPELYAVFAELDAASLDAPAARLLERTLRDFRRSGVDRDEATRARLRELSEKGLLLSQAFSKNIRENVRSIRVRPEQLDGMPQDWIDAHPAGDDGRVTVTTDYPDVVPFRTFAKDATARRELVTQFLTIGWPANDQVLQDIFAVRRETASLLGYASWADYDAEVKMIGKGTAIAEFIDRITVLSADSAARDKAVLLQRLQQDRPDATDIDGADVAYYAELVRKEQLAVDAQRVRTYFPFESVRRGLLEVTGRLFGLDWTPVTDAPRWHPEVATYDVGFRAGGSAASTSTCIRVTASTSMRRSSTSFAACGGSSCPKASSCATSTGASWSTTRSSPSSTSSDTSSTTSSAATRNGSGSREWPRSGTSSRRRARCWRSGRGTQTYSRRSRATPKGRRFQPSSWRRCGAPTTSARATTPARRCSMPRCPTTSTSTRPKDLTARLTELMRRYSVFPYIEGTHMQCHFGHLDGYGSGYYTYMWSLVIAKDMFSAFDRTNLFDPEIAGAYRDKVLAPGGRRDAADLVEDFLGRPYTFDAYAAWLAE